MIEALVFGCNGDWDLAWNLLPEDDYLEKQVGQYDYETHLIIPGGIYGGRRVAGTLFFIRLHQDIQEVTQEGVRQQLKRATTHSTGVSSKGKGKKSFTKKEVEALVKDYRMDSLLTIAAQDKRILRDLQRLLYTADDLLRCKAAEALGKASALIAQKDPATISRLLQGLFTSISDSAASSWGALNAIGEIIGNSPEQFAGYIPQLVKSTGDKALLPEALRALGKIGGVRPDLIRKAAFRSIPLLRDPDPGIRGYAAILLGNLDAQEAREGFTELLDDSMGIEIYKDGRFEKRTVSQLAAEALKKK